MCYWYDDNVLDGLSEFLIQLPKVDEHYSVTLCFILKWKHVSYHGKIV